MTDSDDSVYDDAIITVEMQITATVKYPRSMFVDKFPEKFDPEFVKFNFEMFKAAYENDKDFLVTDIFPKMNLVDAKINDWKFYIADEDKK